MKCPFRVNQKVEEFYYYSQEQKGNNNIVQYFPDCYEDACPYYSKEDDTCFRVGAEMVRSGLGIIKEIKELKK